MSAYRAAPWATTSSGDMERSGSLPVTVGSISPTMGMRLDPPTSSTRSICRQLSPACLTTSEVVVSVRSSRSRGEVLELLAGDFDPHADARVEADDGGLVALGEGVLGLLGVEPELGGVLGVAARIDAVGLEELLGQVVDQPLVEVVAAQMHVAVGGQGAEPRAGDFQDRHVEGAAAQVVDQHALPPINPYPSDEGGGGAPMGARRASGYIALTLPAGKGDRHLLCEAPGGPFRQKVPVPFSALAEAVL